MKKVQVGNTTYEVNIKYKDKGESLQKLLETLVLYKDKKENELKKY